MPTTPLKKKLILILNLIVLLLFCIVAFIVYPAVKKVQQLRTDVAKIESELEQKYENSQKLRRTMRELDYIKTEIINFENSFIKIGDELKVITELENIAEKNNVEQTLDVRLINYKDLQVKKGEKRIIPPLQNYYEFSFSNNAFFEDHIKYLQEIEKLPYYVVFQRINFEKNKKQEEEKAPVALNFTAIIYAEDKS